MGKILQMCSLVCEFKKYTHQGDYLCENGLLCKMVGIVNKRNNVYAFHLSYNFCVERTA